jgi:hypothetical protein
MSFSIDLRTMRQKWAGICEEGGALQGSQTDTYRSLPPRSAQLGRGGDEEDLFRVW